MTFHSLLVVKYNGKNINWGKLFQKKWMNWEILSLFKLQKMLKSGDLLSGKYALKRRTRVDSISSALKIADGTIQPHQQKPQTDRGYIKKLSEDLSA